MTPNQTALLCAAAGVTIAHDIVAPLVIIIWRVFL